MLLTSTLIPARAFSVRLQPALIAPCCATASFTTSARPTKIQRTARPFLASQSTPIQTAIRHASTTPEVSSTTSPASTTADTATRPSKQLTWNDFLALRRTRRKISVVASSFSAVAVTYTGLKIFIDQGYDGTLAVNFGLDPLMVTGLSAIGMLAVGWLVGPFFGNAIFNLRYRGIRGDIESVRLSPSCTSLLCILARLRQWLGSGEPEKMTDSVCVYRKSANSTTASSVTASTRPPPRWRTPSPTTTARRSAAWQPTGGG